MKKIVNTSMIYFIFAIIGGVFYREFTKWNGFTGKTMLSVVHVHLLVLGMFLFLLVLLLYKDREDLLKSKKFKRFYLSYNIALPFFVLMLVVRGVIQVLGISLSITWNASISGIAGISHIFLFVSLIFFYVSLKDLY